MAFSSWTEFSVHGIVSSHHTAVMTEFSSVDASHTTVLGGSDELSVLVGAASSVGVALPESRHGLSWS